MQCWTLHSNHSLNLGIPCIKTVIDTDKQAWTVYTGSPAPLGILETTHFPVTDRITIDCLAGSAFNILLDHSARESHTLLVKNQSPIGGAWSLELLGNAEIISSGYVPKVRGVAQGEGAEYLLNLPYGSMIKVALCGNTQGQPKYFTINALTHLLLLEPCSYESFMTHGMNGTQQILSGEGW